MMQKIIAEYKNLDVQIFSYFGRMELARNGDLRQVILDFFETTRHLVISRARVQLVADQEKAVHELRVATKKIRTVYRFIERISNGAFRQKAEIAELRKLFQAAGGLRELQVHQVVLDDYEQLHVAYYKKMSRLLANATRAARPRYEVARKVFDGKSLEASAAKVAKILAAVPEEEVHSALVTFAMERLAGSAAVMPAGYDPEKIHKSRILLKEAMYLMGLLHAAGYTSDFDPSLLPKAKYAAEIAGDWHDREVFGQWLQVHIQNGALLRDGGKGYSILLQDLHMHTRSLVRRFRDAIETLPAGQNLSESGQ